MKYFFVLVVFTLVVACMCSPQEHPHPRGPPPTDASGNPLPPPTDSSGNRIPPPTDSSGKPLPPPGY